MGEVSFLPFRMNGINYKAEVKLVWDDAVREFRIDDSIEYKFDYYESSMESMISGFPKGWYDYKELEWVKVSATQEQLKGIRKSLNSKSSFEIE